MEGRLNSCLYECRLGHSRLKPRPHRFGFRLFMFYLDLDERGEPLCAVPEVNNTFGEMKPFLLGRTSWKAGGFQQRVPKVFYVSPFMNLDVQFGFHLSIPKDTVSIQIEDFEAEERIFHASLHGVRRPLTDARLAWFSLKYPCLTLRIMLAIHWQALRLVLKRVAFHRKGENPEMQRGFYAACSRSTGATPHGSELPGTPELETSRTSVKAETSLLLENSDTTWIQNTR